MQVAGMNQPTTTAKTGDKKLGTVMWVSLGIHAWTFAWGLIHWILFWFVCPINKDILNGSMMGGSGSSRVLESIKCPTTPTRFYTWVLLVSWLAYLAAVVVNILIDQKKNEAKLTSYISLAASAIGIYYIIAYWVGEVAKEMVKADARLKSGSLKAAQVFYWFYLVGLAASIAFPTFFGGLMGNPF
jgi:hypothetical protein